MSDLPAIAIEKVDHIGIRVRELDRALAFYRVLGFELRHKVEFDDVAIIRNRQAEVVSAGGPTKRGVRA